MNRGYNALLALVMTVLLCVAMKGDAGLEMGHDIIKSCDTCHLNMPEKTGGGRKMLFTSDFSFMCSRCHPGAKALSHPVDMPAGRRLPASFPLDWKGHMTCVTCHLFHDNADISFLRMGERGKDFCLMCHDMEFFRNMRDRGEALSGAHLEARSATPKRFEFVDQVSIACLSCHDGTVSIDVIKSASASGFVSHGKGASHPIGTDYGKVAQLDMSYYPPAQLPSEIHLPDGKLGCTSCHAPYKEKHGSLVMKNRRSRLCLSCHKK